MPVDIRPFAPYRPPSGESRPSLAQVFRMVQALDNHIRTSPTCFPGCPDCHAGTFTPEEQMDMKTAYRFSLSIDEAQAIVRPLLSEIQEHKGHIAAVLASHADDLMARWSKKGRFGTPQKRQDLLKTVAPDLPESSVFFLHWGYYLYWERKDIMSRSPHFQHKVLLPWLTVDLLKTHPDALFALLHNRTVHGPEEWAAFDYQQLTKHFQNGDFDTDWSSKAMVMHGKHTYGTLVDWDILAIHRADLIGFPGGLLVLKAQAYLMQVLRNIVDAVMMRIPISVSGRTDKWLRVIQAGDFKATGSVEPWSSYTHGFLCAAPQVDGLDYLALIRSRRERSEDHLRALQCNIPYMRRQIQSLSETSVWQGVSAAEKCTTLGNQMHFAAFDYIMWRSLESEVQHFDEIRLNYGDNVAQGKPLPNDYDRALGSLGLLLINHIIARSRALLHEMAFAPGFSMHWTRMQQTGGGPMRRKPVANNNTMGVFNEDRLYWILAQLCNHPEKKDAFDFPMLIAMLHEHLAVSSRKERERLDELTYQHVTDIAACHELIRAVNTHRPQSTNFAMEDALKTQRLAWRVFAGRGKAEDFFLKEQIEKTSMRICPELVNAFKMQKPPKGLRGKVWVQYTRQLHSALDKFWGSMKDAVKIDLAKMGLTSDKEGEFFGVFAFGTSTEHVEALRAEERSILAEEERRRTKLASPVPIFTDSQSTSLDVDAAIARNKKKKKKTRPEREVPDADPNPAKGASGLEADLPKLSLAADDAPVLDPIPVSRRNFNEVFGAMFPCDRAEAKRSVDWSTFARAMKAIGCALDNGGGGSEVLFRHEKFGKITFHRPHPEPKIDPIKLHAWGDRLARRFRWSRARFVVATNVTEGDEI